MKNRQIILALGGYIFLMGLVGYIRTGSMAPIIIAGSMGLITAAFGHFLKQGRKRLRNWLMGWLVVCVFLFGASALDLVGSHRNPQPGYEYVFGSMVLFAGYAMYRLYKTRRTI